MAPIVDGFEDDYGDQITFERLNALDNGVGQATFDQLRLPGHPSFVLFSAEGMEVWRGFGQQDAALIENAIQDVLDSN